MRNVSAQDLIEFLEGEPQPLRYTPSEISSILKKTAEASDDLAFGKVVDAYVDFTKRYWMQENHGSQYDAEIGALENMACAAVVADLGLRQPVTNDERIDRMYRTPAKHGQTMQAFMRHLGWDGDQIASRLLKETREDTPDIPPYILN